MPVDQLTPYLPGLAIAAGTLVLLWGQRDRLKSLFSGTQTATKVEPEMPPAERFATLYALRCWCQAAGHAEAVRAIDTQVLPTIVRGGSAKEGGATP